MPSPVPSPLRDATPTRRGLVGITDQTIAGMKTFLDAVKLALRTTATLPEGGAELEGSLVFDTTTKRLQVHDGEVWQSAVMATSGEDAASLEEHLTSTSAHGAASITYYDTNVQEVLEELSASKVTGTVLAATGGSALVGAPASAAGPTPETFAAGTSRTQLDALLGWVNARARKAVAETITALWTFDSGIMVNGPFNKRYLFSMTYSTAGLAAVTSSQYPYPGNSLVTSLAVVGSSGTTQNHWQVRSANTRVIGAVVGISGAGDSTAISVNVRLAYMAGGVPHDVVLHNFTIPAGESYVDSVVGVPSAWPAATNNAYSVYVEMLRGASGGTAAQQVSVQLRFDDLLT